MTRMMTMAVVFLASTMAIAFEQPLEVVEVNSDYQSMGASTRYSTTKEIYEDEVYSSNLKMREERKIGAGIQVGGGLGTAGLNLEVNIDSENAAIAGVGTGVGYGTFQILWRHSFEGKYFTPYATGGWARWYNSASSEDYKKSLILDRVLNDDQKESGRFGVDFLTASFGMQYNQLSGEMAGTTFFAEFGLLSSFGNLTPIPTGSVGATYYF